MQTIYGGKIGNVETDIDMRNYDNNAPTFVGCFAKIIQRLKTIQPYAKFFLVTMPTDNGSEAFHSVIDGIVKKFDNCYVIDLFHYASVYDDEFRKKYFSGHMNAMGYLLTAHYIMTYIDWIIRNN